MLEKAYSTAVIAADTQKVEELLSELVVSERRSREAKCRAVKAEKYAEGLDAKFKSTLCTDLVRTLTSISCPGAPAVIEN
jgi:hypothetical protein